MSVLVLLLGQYPNVLLKFPIGVIQVKESRYALML
jgi:hypothetical protein